MYLPVTYDKSKIISKHSMNYGFGKIYSVESCNMSKSKWRNVNALGYFTHIGCNYSVTDLGVFSYIKLSNLFLNPVTKTKVGASVNKLRKQ